ncbi:MAG TPA: hypothetical protein VF432_18195 [Thermoanaerobaculia bacterium]
MTTLREVVGAILRDIDAAQTYAGDSAIDAGRSADDEHWPLPVPKARIDSVDLELRYGVEDLRQAAKTRTARPDRMPLAGAASRIAAAAGDAVAKYLSDHLGLAAERPRWDRIIENVHGAEFQALLAGRLADALRREWPAAAGQPGKMSGIVHAALAEHLFANPAFGTLFHDGSAAREQVAQRLAPLLAAEAELLSTVPAVPALPDLDVIVVTRELADWPEPLLSRLRLHVIVRDSPEGTVACES